MGRPQQPGTDAIGTLDLLILSRLARGPMHGFGIAEYLHGISDALHVEGGSRHPALCRLEPLGVKVAWLAGSLKPREKKAALEAIAAGTTQLAIGTHALFQEGIGSSRRA